MTVIFDDEDYLKATEPFNNGCAFKPMFKQDGIIFLDIGCYLLVNLITGSKKALYDKYVDNGEQPFQIKLSPEAKNEMLNRKPCRHCGGIVHEVVINP